MQISGRADRLLPYEYRESGDAFATLIDNNRAENAIRPFIVGRKNWLFSLFVFGAKANANLCSLIETAKTHCLHAHAYLRSVFEQLPYAQTIADFEAPTRSPSRTAK